MNTRQQIIDNALKTANDEGFGRDLSFVVDYFAQLVVSGKKPEL